MTKNNLTVFLRRQTGYSTVVKRLAEENENVRIVCSSPSNARRFGKSGMTLIDIDNKTRGSNFILIPDNELLMDIVYNYESARSALYRELAQVRTFDNTPDYAKMSIFNFLKEKRAAKRRRR